MIRPPEPDTGFPKKNPIRHTLERILWAMVRHRRLYNVNRLGNSELARAKKNAF